MKSLKIYLETTVFNFIFAEDSPDKKQDVIKLFDEIKKGKYVPYTSDYVLQELLKAEEPKRTKMVNLLDQYGIKLLTPDKNAENLADKYVTENIIPMKYRMDCLKILLIS